jgi:hypothetical protein
MSFGLLDDGDFKEAIAAKFEEDTRPMDLLLNVCKNVEIVESIRR